MAFKPPGTRGLKLDEPAIFERSRPGRRGYSFPEPDVPEPAPLDEALVRKDRLAGLPELSEVEVVRHFTRLSTWNYGVDTGFYPLGSCTMKYNPKINELVARRPGFALTHPLAPEALCQGALAVIFHLEAALAEISGFEAVTLQPSAGAQGELCGLMMVRAHHMAKGNPRSKVLVPDTAHGTNPASSTLNGYRAVEIPSGEDGVLHPEAVAALMDEDVAALMLTNPNTLGLFERHIAEIAEIVHARGGLVYCDGANLNALMGVARPGDMGVDVMQFNLHKTFSTPHGGGGPGSGPVGVAAVLEPYLPVPRVVRREDGDLALDNDRPQSIGKLRAFYGNFGVMVRAYTYIRELGAAGLKQATELAVLNANYLRAMLQHRFHLAHDRLCMHECVFTDRQQKPAGVKTLDIAKRLIDLGFHPPTIYFPLVVDGAMMIEPTETESLENLDQFVAAMQQIADEAEQDPERLTAAPRNTRLGRLDETAAARKPVLTWEPEGE